MECDPLTAVAPCESSKQYNVFINHRGPDVKHNLAIGLHGSFQEANIDAYLDIKDNELGDSIPSNIKNAILSASVHVAILSARYAQSAWCLAELTLMLQTGATIIPVFYNVKPSDLRHKLRRSYRKAFSRFREKGRYLNQLEEWKGSLEAVSYYMGEEVIWKPNLDTNELRNRLVFKVEKLLVKRSVHLELERTVQEKRNVPLQVARYKVGLNGLIEDFKKSWCQKSRERNGFFGIYGSGGSGKTTLAKEFFNRNFSDYERSSFLFNVRETSDNGKLASLQNKLLTDLFPTWNQKITSIEEGRILLKYSLQNLSSFIVVIDDVDDLRQLNALVPFYNLNNRSLVIVTAREKCVLTEADISVHYKIKRMKPQHGIELFSYYAFDKPDPPIEYFDLVSRFVEKCQGLPLSIQVLGCHVSHGIKNGSMLELENVRKTLDIKGLLQLCYDTLEEEEKEIFLDIACLFIEKSVKIAKRLWKAKGWNAERALQTLENKCFVDVVPQGFDEEPPADVFRMHHELRQLGTEMARERQIRRPWRQNDKLLVLNNFKKVLQIKDESFRCLNSIRDMSITYFLEKSRTTSALQWIEFNSKSIPSWIPLQNLEGLSITAAGIPKRWWQEHKQGPQNLKELLCEFTELHCTEKEVLKKNWNKYSMSLGMLSGLESLILKLKSKGKRTDIEVEWSSFLESVIEPASLVTLGLFGCCIKGNIHLNSSRQPADTTFLGCLETITLNNLRNTSKVSIIGNYCPILKCLKIESMEALVEVNLEGLERLKCLKVFECHKLKKLLGSGMLELEMLSIESCSELETLLNLQGLRSLKRIRIMFCEVLQAINGMKCLSSVEDVTITGCSALSNLTGIEELKRLRGMILSGGSMWKCVSGFERLPSEFTVVMGRPAMSSLNEDGICKVISTVDSHDRFESRREGYQKLRSLQKSQQSFGAIILCAMVVSKSPAYMDREPQFGGTVPLSWGSDEKLVYTIVVTDPNETSIVSNGIPSYCWMPTFELINRRGCLHPEVRGRIVEGFIIGLNKGRECETLPILKILTDQLYTAEVVTDTDTDYDSDWGDNS
ncbi:hypothetical protein SUGI_0435540 [Cryptomeria japonica]|uniref:disease resistance protein RPV1-like n=1 Tax=Cryptomeria japonica TaxID=3369 RepID=UPI002408EEA4|nr:disease resistance protein RPV1-like [Cryptomeria japonica]XP_059076034.1 disease resistance protein RPV1-like [Cryptomeria japonica]XP_059076035.1 disease resistance protein RPV1-like [Cryptomeria japonica]GLJ23075.1 hypothetical protein SUGI_0435540 [Cryptomeria japonica]